MEATIAYLISVNLLLLLPVIYYRLLLARQSRFRWNRIFLVGSMVAALLLPLLQLDILPASLPNPSFIQTLPGQLLPAPPSAMPAVAAHTETLDSPIPPAPRTLTATAPVAAAPFQPWDIVLAVYWAGVATALLVLLWRNLSILRLIGRGTRTRQDGYTLVATQPGIGPATYFRYILWNPHCDLDTQSQAVAIAHETCHARQLHTLDLLLVELIRACCWMNPAIYLLRKDLRQTHEFLADQAALGVAGVDGIKRLLLQHQIGARQLAIANYFHSSIKARMKMLHQNPIHATRWHYLLILPFIAVMVACTSLGHPLDNQMTVAASPATEATTSSAQDPMPALYSIEDMLIKAQMPLSSGESNATQKGMVCLGRQPQVLDLDAIVPNQDYKPDTNAPQWLNPHTVLRAIGFPVDETGAKVKGKIVTKLLVDETGHVIRHQYLEPGDARLRDAVEAHIHELLFKPGREDGKPAEWWVIMPFSFGIRGPGC